MNCCTKVSITFVIFLTFCVFLPETHAQFFTRVTNIGPIVTDSVLGAGGSWTDINNDGFPDLYAGGNENNFYMNEGNGTFSKITGQSFVQSQVFSILGIWGDYNSDGFEDVYLINYSNSEADNLYKNTGPPNFDMELTIAAQNAKTLSASGSWIDFDRDGDLDFYLLGEANNPDIFYENDGAGNLTVINNLPFLSNRRPGNANQDVWIDYDNDGDLDLFIKIGSSQNLLYKSLLTERGDPKLFEQILDNGLFQDFGIFDVGSSWGDYDNDGDFDMFLAVSGAFGQGLADQLYQNNGDGTFTKTTNNPIVNESYNTSYGAWGDYDNDGDIDLFVAEVGLGFSKSKLFRNEGNGEFIKMDSSQVGEIIIDLPRPQSGNWEDYDNDGDLDLLSINYSVGGKNQPYYLIRNNSGNSNNWINISCKGNVSNKNGIGTKIKIKADINGSTHWQHRYISGGTSSFAFQTMKRAHFGLGNAVIVDSIIIGWPSGITQVLTNVSPNQFLTVEENVPNAFIRADFASDTTFAPNTDSLSVQFEDRSFSLQGFPITTWEWDFDGDNIVDSNIPNPFYTYANSGEFTVTLTISNGTSTSTISRSSYIQITGPLPIIEVNTKTIAFGTLQNTIPQIDTSFFIKNIGGAADSITIDIDYHNIKDSTAVLITPRKFELAAKDSQEIKFTAYPPKITPSDFFYRPKAVINSKYGYGTTNFIKQFSFKVTEPTFVENKDNEIPNKFELLNNYPNPFNPSTIIKFSIPRSGIVSLIVYDILGREIAVLVDEWKPSGNYSVDFNASNLLSGIYFYKIVVNNFSSVKKMILLK